MGSLDLNLEMTLIWVHLSNISSEVFNQKGIWYLASGLDTPFFIDKVTAVRQRVAFAWVCVEVEATKEIPDVIKLVLPNKKVSIYVETPWLPSRCSKCRVFGHTDRKFIKNIGKGIQEVNAKEVKTWVKKAKNAEGKNPGSGPTSDKDCSIDVNGEIEVSNKDDDGMITVS